MGVRSITLYLHVFNIFQIFPQYGADFEESILITARAGRGGDGMGGRREVLLGKDLIFLLLD